MSHSLVVLLGNGRRQRVNVKPTTPVLLVLEEVCKKQGLNADDYDLKFHSRILDLTSTVQFCGVSNNAQLELIPAAKSRVASPVSVFLQLEDGNRLSGSFLPSCTLSDIINQLCSEEIKSKENPVVIYTRQEVIGDKLKTTTLKMLGLTSGNALLRLMHRTREQLKTQSVSKICTLQPKPKPVEEKKPKPEESLTKNTEKINEPSDSKVENADEAIVSNQDESQDNTRVNVAEKMDIDEDDEKTPSPESPPKKEETLVASPLQKKEEPSTSRNVRKDDSDEETAPFNINEVQYIGERYALIFKIDSVQSPRFDDQTDDFYELTVEDAKTLLRDIKRTRSELEEASLETSSIRARKKSLQLERTLTLYPHCVIRIIFPNRIVLQGVFKSSETVLEVVKFAKNFLETPSLDFYLYISPPKTILKNDQRLVEIGAVPGINLYFGSESIDYNSSQDFIQEKFIKRLVSPSIAFRVANHFRKMSKKNKDTEPKHLPENIDRDAEQDLAPSARPAAVKPPVLPKNAPSGKVPKWFKKP
ncbi:tether containing UBX domain for GLUT4 [Planococcus citri]|uniref:tether containing UBX domain for GLUT4 n=1 Tax=Planococcus citri TaxID=170843 RepID=UPI0031F81A3F